MQQTAWSGVVTRAQAGQSGQTIAALDEGQDMLQLMPFSSEEIVRELRPTEEERYERRRQWVWEVMSPAAEGTEEEAEPDRTDACGIFPANLATLQKDDLTLAYCFKHVRDQSSNLLAKESFIIENGLLYRDGEDGKQLVLPESCRKEVLKLGHSIPSLGLATWHT